MRIYKRKKIIERIILIGPMAENKKWLDWCYENGYSAVRTTPKPIRRYIYDLTKFKIVAEKVIG